MANIVTDFGAVGDGVTDDSAAFQAAFNSVRGKIEMPPLDYAIYSSLTMSQPMQALVGEGRGCSRLISYVTNAPTIQFSGSPVGVEIRNVWFERLIGCTGGENAIDTTTGTFPNLVTFSNLMITNHWHGLNLGNTGWSFIEDCYVANNYSDGIQMPAPVGGGALQWTLKDCLLELNDGYGMVLRGAASGTSSCPLGEWNNVSTFANRDGGIAVLGNAHTRFQAVRMMGGFLGGDGACGLLLDTFSLYPHKILGVYTELSGTGACGRGLSTTTPAAGYGIMISANNATTAVGNCFAYGHSASGLYTAGANTIITGGDYSNNGASNIVGNRNGIYVGAGRAQIENSKASVNQYGIAWVNDNHIITGNSLSGNTTAPYFNGVPIVKTIVGSNQLT